MGDKCGVSITSHKILIVTALRPGEHGGTVLRLHEAAGRPARNVRVGLAAQVDSAAEADLMEDAVRELRVNDGAVELDFRPFEIKTIRFGLAHGR